MAVSEAETPPGRAYEVSICTETLARLYLKQGFVEHALAIYRRLSQEQPGNQALHERLRTLEQQLALGVLGPDASGLPSVPGAGADPAASTIRCQELQVLAHLERWLRYLQQQRRQRTHTSHGKRC